jgi:uncharacterized protein YbaR (Trm112 family)
MNEEMTEKLPISADLLAILRDPLAVQDKGKYGDDPGRLELVHNCWLVSKDTGYKYPIKEGIPVMLIEEGRKWKDTPIEDLPVPPPPLIAETPSPTSSSSAFGVQPSYYQNAGPNKLFYIIPLLIGLGLVLIGWQYFSRRASPEA